MAISVAEKITGSVSAILKSLECAICLELLQNPVSTGCGHFFCRFCMTETLQSDYQRPCPLCKKPFTRRSIQEAIHRHKVITAAKKLGEVCGNAIGVNFFPKENTQKEIQKNLPDLIETASFPKVQIVLEDVVKSKKRKSEEILLNGEPDASENLIPQQKLQNQTEVNSSADEAIPPTTKRYCQTVSDDDDSNELPSLENYFSAARQKVSISSASKDETDAKNMPLLIARKEPDEKLEEKKLVIRRKTQKDIPKKIDNVIFKNKKNVLALKNKTNLDKECGEVTNKNLSEKSEIFSFCESNEICKENKKSFGTVPNKYKSNKVQFSKKKSRNSESCVSNSSAEEDDFNSKIKDAENHALVIEKNRDNNVDKILPQECYELTEFEIQNNETIQPQKTNSDLRQKNSKIDDIPDTAVSVHTFASPQMSKSNLASKSPGWSRVKKVRKDFKVKKFSRLSVQKNISVCPVEEVSNLEEKMGETLDKQSNCKEISKTVPMAKKLNPNLSQVNVLLESNKVFKNSETLDVMDENMDKDEHMLEVPDTNETNNIEDKVNQMNQEKCIPSVSKMDKNEKEVQSSKLVENGNSVDCLLQAADNGVPCIGNAINEEINFQKKTNMIEEPIPMDTDFQVSNSDIYDANLCPRYLRGCFEEIKENSSNNENNFANMELNNERNDNICKSPVPGYFEKSKENISLNKSNFTNIKLNSGRNDNICKSPVIGLIKESRVSKISKIKGNMSPKSDLLKDVFYVEHSQQTSQRIDFYDAKNQNEPFGSALPVEVPHYHTETFTSNALLPYNKSVPWFYNRENVTSEKTKVIKRTCLTLEEIQDYFTKSTFSGKSQTICSLPFLSDNYKLHICVSDDTLNVSVLKVVESNSSEIPHTKTNFINFPEKSDLHQKSNSVVMPEKSIQTSIRNNSEINLFRNNVYRSRSPTVLPSSNLVSDCSEPEDNSEVVKHKSNPFPFLSKFFSDSESTPQLNDVPDTSNVNCVPDTSNVNCVPDTSNVNCIPEASDVNCFPDTSAASYVSDTSDVNCVPDMSNIKGNPAKSVVKDNEKSNVKLIPGMPNLKDNSDTSNVTTKDSTEIFVLPPLRKISCKFPVQIKSIPNNVGIERNSKETLESDLNQLQDSVNTIMNSKASKEKDKNSIYSNEKSVEMIDISSQVSKDQDADCSISKQSHPTRKTAQYQNKKLDSEFSEESYKKALCDDNDDDDDFLSELSDSKHLQTSSYYARLIKERDAHSSDPAMAFANDLVAPLKNIADKMNSVSHGSNANKHKLTVDSNEKNLEANETTSKLEHVLNLLPKRKNSLSNTNTKQKVSRLSLKKKKKSSRFKRIQSNSGSDSDESESSKIDEVAVGKSTKSPSPINKNLSTATFQEQSTLNSLLSDDVNSSQIVKEIEDIDQEIRSVQEKLKMYGHGNLLSEDNMLSLEDIRDEESEDSDDLFSQSIPPTPPETIGISKDSTFKKPKLNY